MFKTERKQNNRNNDRHYLSNSFRPKGEQVVKKFEIKEEDFPELHFEGETQIKNENVLQYKNAMLKRDETEEVKRDDLKPGWARLYYDKNRKIVVEKYEENRGYEEDFHSHAQRVFQSLVDKWENERIAYNNLYGEGEYERIYYMPKREDDNYYDYEEEDETVPVEEEYYDEESQYYDLY